MSADVRGEGYGVSLMRGRTDVRLLYLPEEAVWTLRDCSNSVWLYLHRADGSRKLWYGSPEAAAEFLAQIGLELGTRDGDAFPVRLKEGAGV